MRALPDRTTAEALAMGIDRSMASYKTYNSGTWDRITNLRLAVTLLDGTLVPSGRDVLAERRDRRADDRARLPARPRDHRHRVRGGGRRRHLAGRDDRLQRRLGGGAQDHRAQSAQPLHQPVPARARRHRVLAVPGPQVPERHEELGPGEGHRRVGRDPRGDLRRRAPARRELVGVDDHHRDRRRSSA